jgi:NTP pyrophosphatase (non-canonical NTP hydrolase)
MNVYELHCKMTKHLFPAFSSEDERFLSLALCGEAGELADMIVSEHFDIEEARDEAADIRVYLELIAKCFGIEGEKLEPREVPEMVELRLVLALCAKCGLLANLVKKRWRDDADLAEECKVKIVEVRSLLEQVAYRLGIEGVALNDRVETKLAKVAERRGLAA